MRCSCAATSYAECMCGAWDEDRPSNLRAQLADKDAQIAALKAALLEACEIANEGWEYAGDYFRDKWLPPNRIDELRKLAEGT